MARPGNRILEFTQGDDVAEAFMLRNKTTQQPLNVTGWVGACQIRDKDDALLATATVTINHAVAPGIFIVQLTDVQTAALPPATTHRWDVELTDASGFKRTWLSGQCIINSQVTKP